MAEDIPNRGRRSQIIQEFFQICNRRIAVIPDGLPIRVNQPAESIVEGVL
jgi:hypothetical protein